MFDRVAIIGTGLIGGSVGLGLRATAAARAVVGYDVDPRVADSALDLGALSEVAADGAGAAHGADLVVLATPVDRMAQACLEVASGVGTEAVVTDVGSAKVEVVGVAEERFGTNFVGGHPMAGSERHGIDAADERLFADAWWILTPTARTSSAAYRAATRLATALGATPVAISPPVHDRLVARVSHVPQLAASAIVELAAAGGDRDALLGLAGPGFRDVTRIAASNPDLWVAILRSNRAAVLDALGGFSSALGRLVQLVEDERWGELGQFLERTRRARMELFAKPDYGGDPVTLAVPVPDRPGVLAEVTTAAGELGANIEDLRIIHSTEGGRGRLELVVSGRDRAEALVAALVALGYRVDRTED